MGTQWRGTSWNSGQAQLCSWPGGWGDHFSLRAGRAANWSSQALSFLGSARPERSLEHDRMLHSKLGNPFLLNLDLFSGGDPEAGT